MFDLKKKLEQERLVDEVRQTYLVENEDSDALLNSVRSTINKENRNEALNKVLFEEVLAHNDLGTLTEIRALEQKLKELKEAQEAKYNDEIIALSKCVLPSSDAIDFFNWKKTMKK